jgi:hypothetical protein
MLDAVENDLRCAISEHSPSFNEINDLARTGENAMVRRNRAATMPNRNDFWG